MHGMDAHPHRSGGLAFKRSWSLARQLRGSSSRTLSLQIESWGTRRSVVVYSIKGSGPQTNVSVPPASSVPRGGVPPTVAPLSWAFAAGLIAISVAAASLAQTLLNTSKSLSTHDGHAPPNAPLSSSDEATVAAIGPLLLAAETAGIVDETETMTEEELQTLDLNIRMLITQMDAQLSELQDTLAALLPSEAGAALDTALERISEVEMQLNATEHGSEEAAALEKSLTELQWDVFKILQPAALATEDARRYRSLLYNRGVQTRLLQQVERQVMLRTKMQTVEARLLEIKAGMTAGSREETGVATSTGGEPDSPVGVRLTVAGVSIPHPRKVATGGEDAFFASSKDGAFGIADGVGGWKHEGIDPSLYPRKLIASCNAGAATHADPLMILKQAYAEAHAPGSCTVALARLDGDVLRVASLGDCGIKVVRGGRVIFASEVQEHKFNQPFQLGSPKFLVGDTPSDARRYAVAMEKGDIAVMGSDGLWDNLWDHELESVLEKAGVVLVEEADVAAVAQSLADLASAHSRDCEYVSPFAAEKHERLVPAVLRAMVAKPRGGKPDDITAVVAAFY